MFCIVEGHFLDLSTTFVQATASIGGMIGMGVFSRTDIHVCVVAFLHVILRRCKEQQGERYEQCLHDDLFFRVKREWKAIPVRNSK